jgi:uncharacterized protein YlxW (UPF0749 family)
MPKTKRIPLIITLISIIIGFMLAIQFQSNKTILGAESKDISQLRQDLQKLMERHKLILTDISKYDQLLYQYETSFNQEDSLKVMKDELERIKRLGGLAAVEGPGMIIAITDISTAAEQGTDSMMEIYDDEIRWVINEMFGAGAKAVSINGNRISPTTSIRNAGGQIQVDTRVIALPYQIKIIGQPESLESAIKFLGFEQYFSFFSKKISWTKLDKVSIPAYHGKGMIKYMKPAKDGS